MTEPVSLHAFCRDHGNLPKTSVRRWLNDHGYSTSDGLSSVAVEAALEQFCPAPAEVLEPEMVDATEAQMVVHSPAAGGLVPLNIQNLTINITQANTAALEEEAAHFQQVNAAGLQAIGQYLQADLNTTVHHAIAQQRHAVAGLAAQGAVSLANSLGKPPADTDTAG